jgi:Ca2+-binding RTX toxin-like protein
MHGKRLMVLCLFIASIFVSLAASAAAENFVLILDASNSMNKPFNTETRLEAAKAALGRLLEVIPDGTNLGLFDYGERVDREDREQSCKDIEQLFPIAPLTSSVREGMERAVAQATAKGLTPLAGSLLAAADALAAQPGEGEIILLSDGEETCGGDALAAARAIASRSPRIMLYVVGLDVDATAQQALTALAEATGGQYRHVDQAGDLFSALFAAVAPMPQPAGSDIPPEYAALAKAWGITNVIIGTEGDDILYGTPGNDLILGLGGNDFLIGLGGNDILVGGDGCDIIEGGDENDILMGGNGDDTMFGGAGDDILCAGPGNDSLEGEAGNDWLDGGPGDDRLLGGSGTNRLYGGGGRDILLEGEIVATPCPICGGELPCCAAEKRPQPPVEPAYPARPVEPPCAVRSDKSVDEGSRIQLHGNVTDKDCNVVSVLWEASRGSFGDPRSLDPMYCAPLTDSCEGEDVLITLTATDRCGATGRDSFVLHVNNVNHPPTVSAGEDVVVDEGETIVLVARASDPDGDLLTYRWSVECDKGRIEDPSLIQAFYTAPLTDRCDGETIVLTLTVTDPCGASACDSIRVHVRNKNRAPILNLGPAITMQEGTCIRLTPVVNDPECDPLVYHWVASKGSFDNAYAATPTYTAPLVDTCDGEDVLITLTVTDPCGLSACDTVSVHVTNVNNPPVVNADP